MVTDEVANSYVESTPEQLVVLPFYFPVQIIKNGIDGTSKIDEILQRAEHDKMRDSDPADFVRACEACTKYYDDAHMDSVHLLLY